jgi:hypothetical protein
MAFNINEFRSQIASRGLAKSSLFYVTITLPNTLANSVGSIIDSNTLSFFCETASLPGMDLQLSEIRKHGYGKAYKRPMDFTENSLPLVFMVDAEFGVMKYFHRWMQSIFNYNNGSAVREDPQGKLPYEFEYHDNYTATIEIYMFSSNDIEKVYHYKFSKAYPTSIGQVDVAWEINDQIMKLPVTFEYDYMSTEALEWGSIRPDLSRQNGVLTYLSSLNSYGQAIAQIQRPTNVQDAIVQWTNINTIYNSL